MNQIISNLTPSAIHIAIAEDHELVREGICSILESFEHFSVVIRAIHGKQLIDKISSSKTLPDVCFLDVQMPELNGYKTLREIKKKWPQVKVIILTMLSEKFVRQRAMLLGADGYLIKNCKPQMLRDAVYSVLSNDYYFYEPETGSYTSKKGIAGFPVISEREVEFLRLCGTKMSYEEMAEIFKVSIRTVQSYQNSLAEKLQLKTRTQLALFAKDVGLE